MNNLIKSTARETKWKALNSKSKTCSLKMEENNIEMYRLLDSMHYSIRLPIKLPIIPELQSLKKLMLNYKERNTRNKWGKQTSRTKIICAHSRGISGQWQETPKQIQAAGSAFIGKTESPSVCSSQLIMHSSSPHPTHSHNSHSEQGRCYRERKRERVKNGWEKYDERDSYMSHQSSLTTSSSESIGEALTNHKA